MTILAGADAFVVYVAVDGERGRPVNGRPAVDDVRRIRRIGDLLGLVNSE